MRVLFAQTRVFLDLLKGHVKRSLWETLDLSTAERVSARHVSDDYLQRENDAVWKLRALDGRDVYVYIMVEYQARWEWDMACRMFTYIMELYAEILREPEIQERRMLPQVLPIVVYTGQAEWQAERDLRNLIEPIVPGLEDFCPSGSYLLIDARRVPVLARSLRNVADVIFRLQRMKSREEGQREVRHLEDWLPGKEWKPLRRSLAKWIADVLPPQSLPDMRLREVEDLGEVREMFDEEAVTLADRYKAEGHDQGLEVGRVEGRVEGLVSLFAYMTRRRFGDRAAKAAEALLGPEPSEEVVRQAGDHLLECASAEELLAKVSGLQGGQHRIV